MGNNSLRNWFIVHCYIDLLFAAPLIIAPRYFLTLFGWTEVDPLASRLVGAALIGIGVESFLGRNASVEHFKGMLRLKVLWSSSATFGIALSIYQGASPFAWLFLIIFAAFCSLWSYYKIKLG